MQNQTVGARAGLPMAPFSGHIQNRPTSRTTTRALALVLRHCTGTSHRQSPAEACPCSLMGPRETTTHWSCPFCAKCQSAGKCTAFACVL